MNKRINVILSKSLWTGIVGIGYQEIKSDIIVKKLDQTIQKLATTDISYGSLRIGGIKNESFCLSNALSASLHKVNSNNNGNHSYLKNHIKECLTKDSVESISKNVRGRGGKGRIIVNSQLLGISPTFDTISNTFWSRMTGALHA